MGHMKASSERFTTAISMRMRGYMMVHARMIAEAKVLPSSGASRLFCEKDKVTAVLETRPPIMPVKASPCGNEKTLSPAHSRRN
jgi:hypothetical protein